MENNILDEIEKKIEPPKFALKSYDQFLTSVLLYLGIIVFIIFVNEMEINISFNFALLFSFVIGTIASVYNFFGIFNCLKSRKNMEIFIWKLLLGGFGNLILFLAWVFILFLIPLLNLPKFYF